MIVAGAALAALLSSCAPSSDPILLAKIVAHESGGEVFAVNDNSTKRTYLPQSRAQAEALLVRLRGHNVDAGLMQLNVGNWSALGVTEATVFDLCTNIRSGARIFAYFYDQAIRRGLAGYNTGNILSPVGARYADLVLRRTVDVPPTHGAAVAPASVRPKPFAGALAAAAASQPAGPLPPPSQLGPARSSSF